MIVQWIKDITLVIASGEDENVENVTLADIGFKAKSVDIVDIVDEYDTNIDIQFGDGSCAFGVDKSSYINVTALWNALGDVPIDEDECIDEDWNGFSKGTHREEIWHFFEDTYNVSVAKDLMGISNSPE